MTKYKSKPEIMWMIAGNAGIYYWSNSPTRRSAIANHVKEYGGA